MHSSSPVRGLEGPVRFLQLLLRNMRERAMAVHELETLWSKAADLAIGFRAGISDRRQNPGATYHQMRESFAAPTPETGTPPLQVIEELARQAEPGINGMAGPRFFGWVIGASHPAGV